MNNNNVHFAVLEKFKEEHEQEFMKELKLHPFLLPGEKLIKTDEVTVSFGSSSLEKRLVDLRDFYIHFYKSGTKLEQLEDDSTRPRPKNASIFIPNIRSLSCDLHGDRVTFSITYWKKQNLKTKRSMKELIGNTLKRGMKSTARISRSSAGSAGSMDDTFSAWPSADSFQTVTIKTENEWIRNKWFNILLEQIEVCAERLGDFVLGDRMNEAAIKQGADLKIQPPEVIVRFQRHVVDLWFLAKQKAHSKVLESRKQLAELLDGLEVEAEASLWNELADEQEDRSLDRHPYIYFDPEDQI